MENRPAEKKMRKCSKCSYKGTKFNVSRHMKVHKQCPYCEYETENASVKLNIHIKENHPDFDPIESVPDYPTFVCDVCSKPVPRSYKFQHNTTNHKRCCYCMYFIKDFKENLNDHLLSIHPESL